MRNVIAIHTEPSRTNHLEHITKLRYKITDRAGEHGGDGLYEVSRHDMYIFVRDNPEQAYAISQNDDTYAYLEEVDDGYTQYVRTMPDSTQSDNLMSLPRF